MTTALTGLPRAFSPYGPGSYIRFFETHTDTRKDVFSDADLQTPIDDADLVADAASTFPVIFFDPSLYRVKVYSSDNVLKVLVDDFDPGLGAGFGVSSVVGISQGGTGANNAAFARTNLGVPSVGQMTAAQDSITTLQNAIAPGLNDDDTLGTLAARDDVSREQLATGFGTVVVQVVDATPYTANTNISTQIPYDDTVPQISEGVEILTSSITLASNSNKVRIFIDGFGYPFGTNSALAWAVFRGSTCIYAKVAGTNSVLTAIATTVIDSPNTTSETTYSVRVGPVGANTVRMNGHNSGRLFGGAAACTMRLEEIEVH